MDFILSLLLHQKLAGSEWNEWPDEDVSPFLRTGGLGALRGLYVRSYRPSQVSLMYDLILLVVALTLALQGILLTVTLGILLAAFSAWTLYRMYNAWPGRTPKRVALYECGMAWEEPGGVRSLRWEQILAARQQGGRYYVLERMGQEHVFHGSLRFMPVGKVLEASLAGLPDPYRPVRLVTCPYCGETISADSTRCLFCLRKL